LREATMEKKTCPTCEREGIGPGVTTLTQVVDGRTYTAEVPAEVCPHCEESLVRGDVLGRFERAVVAAVVAAGGQGGETVRLLRGALGVRATDLADLLGVTPETISRWENGKHTIDRATWATLAALATEGVDGPTATRLRAAASPARLPTVVRLDTAA